ncbi:peptidase M50B-like-domain-containing protein [Mycena maculata]|uniref:Peptidase M50B-like-domain-containing protein n=1 Tax=Mycena maculata TaxID=230809 RepID=A0AAD7H911_9AGAR|nr:peptidase M50B-like-domain-containing protein [Mycena maculata]KAJ7717751.1 peptidase M50B-like-domain-containing protein [Mycena maculata]
MATPTRPPIAPPLGSLAPSATPLPAALQPSDDQIVVLYVILAFAVVIFGFWNVPGVRNCINPLKLFTIGWHELCHITAAILSGGRILKITIDPNVGGATIVEGGRPLFILSSGYIGSTLIGALSLLRDGTYLSLKTILLTILYEALLIGFWFVDHGEALRWYCLFVGVMNILFVIWDVADDRFFHKANDSDATQFAILYPRIGPHLWATFWIVFQLGVLAAFSVLGIMVFKLSDAEMTAQAVSANHPHTH